MLVIRPTCTHAQFTLQQHRHTYVFSYIYIYYIGASYFLPLLCTQAVQKAADAEDQICR